MKNTKRILLAAVAALLLVAVSVGGTLAWLTATTTPVTNTFTTSDINITLAESENLDLQMVPGKVITKDPKVTVVAGSEACYLFVKVEKSANLDNFISYTIAADWTQLKDAEGKNVEGVFYRTVNADAQNAQEFYVLAGENNGQVTVKTSVTKDMMEGLKAENAVQPTLKFTAYAVQSANLPTDMTMEQIWALAQTNGSGT